MKIEHVITEETDTVVYGKTYHDGTYFGDWTCYKVIGRPPTAEELREYTDTNYGHAMAQLKSINYSDHEKYAAYLEACKRWPLKDPIQEKDWKKLWGINTE